MKLLLVGSSSSLWNHAKINVFHFLYDSPSNTWKLLLYFLCFQSWAKYLQSPQTFLLIPFPHVLPFLSPILDMFQFVTVSLKTMVPKLNIIWNMWFDQYKIFWHYSFTCLEHYTLIKYLKLIQAFLTLCVCVCLYLYLYLHIYILHLHITVAASFAYSE